MRAVVQRVRQASVSVDGREVVALEAGLVVLVGFAAGDTAGDTAGPQLARLVHRLIRLRVFADSEGRLNRSLQDTHGALLLIPQITLTASLAKGHRPSFETAAQPDEARQLFDALVHAARQAYSDVRASPFHLHMVVALQNDGPVTVILEEP